MSEEGHRPDDNRPKLVGSAHDVVQARDVTGGVHFYGHVSRFPGPPPRQLPGNAPRFVNRVDELDQLDATSAEDGNGVVIVVGTAGVGKTSLAVRWAHRIKDRFPDGQLYVNLRGYDPAEPVTPEQALDRFLHALHVPRAAIPGELDAKAALYRSLLAEQRVLVVLDNAAAVKQVRPLLPGSSSCLVVVTGRNRLSGLVAREGARRVTLNVLPLSDAVELVGATTAGYRTGDDPDEIAELARLCARLPLALRIASERAASRPQMPMSELIDDLGNDSLWEALSAEDDEEADAVRAVFAWSYRALPDEASGLFRILGLHPGPDFSSQAAAALAGSGATGIRHVLDSLVGMYLLEQTAPNRYQFHDLLRKYSIDRLAREEPEERRREAVHRLLAWYLHTADAAAGQIVAGRAGTVLPPLPPGVQPLELRDHATALAWYEAEEHNLTPVTRAAVSHGFHDLAQALHGALAQVYANRNRFADWIATGGLALASARRLGDRAAEAMALASLGTAHLQSHRLVEAAEHVRAALALHRETGDRAGEAAAVNSLGLVELRLRRFDEAERMFERAAELHGALGDDPAVVIARANLGGVRLERGDPESATRYFDDAIRAHRDSGNHRREIAPLAQSARLHREAGRLDLAVERVERALNLARELESPVHEGYALLELGRVQLARGRTGEALASFHRAVVLHHGLGDRRREAEALAGAGEVCAAVERFDEAVAFHTRALAVHREVNDDWGAVNALADLAVALHLSGDAEAASARWRNALDLLAAHSDDPGVGALVARVTAVLGGSGGG